MTLPDAADLAVAYYLPESLTLVRGADEYPVLSITLLLAGIPDPSEPQIANRVNQGTIAFDVMLGSPPPPTRDEERELRPLFARTVLVELVSGDAKLLASGTGSGTAARVSLAATLGREDILAVIRGLDRQPAGLSLRASISFRAVRAQQTVRLIGRWSDVYDALARRHGLGSVLSSSDLGAAYANLVSAHVLTLSDPTAAGTILPAFAGAARAVVLDEAGQLGGRPAETFTIDLVFTGSGATDRSVTLTCPLEQTLGGALDGLDRDRVISLVSVGPPARQGRAGGSVGPTPRRVRSAPAGRERGSIAGPLRLGLAGAETLATTSRLLDTSSVDRQDPHRLLDLAGHRVIASGTMVGALDNEVVASPSSSIQSLPLVDDETSWVFADRIDPSVGWYVPSFELVQPAPSDDATTSPFVFSFARSGATASGEPGIDATVTLRLRQVSGPAATAALAARGKPPARPVGTDGATVALDLPFRDDSGASRSQRFTASVARDKDVLTVTVQLIDAWARLCYGALSEPGFQVRPATVTVAWAFTGYVVVDPEKLKVVYGAKAALTHVVYAKEQLAQIRGGYLDAAAVTYRSPIGDYALKVPPADVAVSNRPLVVARPQLDPVPGWWRQPVYALRTFLRSQAVDVMLPCVDFGACYVERRVEGVVAIGCQDALRLGQAAWRQYEEVPALADALYRVYRSLQQPGRFLVLPSEYRIGRYPASAAERAYRPLVLLYAVIDANQPESNQVAVDARLQPDLPPYAFARLRARLTSYANDPVVILPTAVECTAAFDWALADIPTVTVAATLQPDALAVSFSADLVHALVLRDLLSHTGIPGSVMFTFPDGSSLRSSILVALGSLTGPLEGGPIEVSIAGGQATLTNRIERPVTVSDLLVGAGAPDLLPVAVERDLDPRAAATVAIPAGTADAWAVYALPPAPPAALEEVRTFVEDIRTNVVFLDLVDHAARGLTRLDVQARLAGVVGTEQVAMTGAPAIGTASFVLPLTSYLAQRVVQYQVTVIRTDGTVTSGGWVNWDLAAAGALVSLTWDALALPANM